METQVRTIKDGRYNETKVKIMGQQKRRGKKDQDKGQNFQNKTGNASTECQASARKSRAD